MSSFDELLAEAEEAGVASDLIERFRAASEASPLRKELKDTKAQVQAAIERAQKAEQVALATQFKELGIKAKPSAFNLPADLDFTDQDALREWAVDQNLIDPPEPQVPSDHLDALDRVAAASEGATPGRVNAADVVLQAGSEEEFWREAEAAGLTTQSAT